MAYLDSFSLPAHVNIYNGNSDRELRIDYGIPENGTNEETGLFIFSPGFGGHIDSNIYKKMRQQFADKFNVVTVQCDYFGNKFMQKASSFNFPNGLSTKDTPLSEEEIIQIKLDNSNLIPILSKYDFTFYTEANLSENENEFVDMGYMQAIDILTAIETMKFILEDNKLIFNSRKIIGFGQSQGAYLLHLANRLAPHLFSSIIDVSAWVEPVYLHRKYDRMEEFHIGKAKLYIIFDYIARDIIKDKTALSLHQLYKGFENGAYIYSCVGTTDHLVNVDDKRKAIGNLKNVIFEVIDQNKVDGIIFKSTDHGLDADFINLVDYAMNIIPPNHKNVNEKLDYYEVISSKTRIGVDYSQQLPFVQFL